MYKTHALATAAFATALVSGPASAVIYKVSGNFLDDSSAVRGTFEIVVDEADLTDVTTSDTLADKGTTSDLEIEPWYGYDVVSATATFDGYTLTETAIVQTQPASLGDGDTLADFYIEGAPIADLDTEDILLWLTPDSFTTFILIGNSTNVGFDDVKNVPLDGIVNELDWNVPGSSGNSSPFDGGGVQIVSVEVVPEPTSLALLGLGGLLVMKRRYRL